MTAWDRRCWAIAIAGFAAFINLYTPQAVLPAIGASFGAGPLATGLAITATLLAVALVAPAAGGISDALGRKRLIVRACAGLAVPSLLVALSPDLTVLIGLRFLQGLLLPFIFTVAIAYVGDECPGAEGVRAAGAYGIGSILGGFGGRLVAGVVTDLAGWRAGFAAVAACTLLGALAIARLLPAERSFRPVPAGLRRTLATMRALLADRRLVMTCGIGFLMLFNMVAGFTYLNFRLAAPPFGLSSAALGAVFTVYLLGLVTTAVSTRLTLRIGRRPTLLCAAGLSLAGAALTLPDALAPIIAGMALLSGGMFVVQTLSLGFIAANVRQAKSTAVGLYVTVYYAGGACGGVLPATLWHGWGWAGVAGLVACGCLAIGGLAGAAWRG